MSSLAERIRGVVRSANPGGRSANESQILNPESLSCLAGNWRDDCFIVERRWESGARHGRDTVAAIGERLAQASGEAMLFGGGAPRPPFVFFDLETTGLSGGAGTQAFLVGCGSFDEHGRFVTRQFLLTRPSGERALLEAVAVELADAGALVTFNGKSFDAPLLESRCLFHRLGWIGGELPHVDVLHPARRFWGDRAGTDCSLSTLERRLMGAKRIGDVAGFEVPARYFQFIRTGDVRPLIAVLEHNRQDLLTLAALASRLLHLARTGPEGAASAAEALALGRTYARAGWEDRARAAFVRAIALSRAPAGAFDPVRIESLRSLALAWRRVRQFEEAAACWRQLLDIRGCPPIVAREATEALAIHHEHRVRDLPTAREFALSCLEIETQPAWTRAVQHRLARIDRKINARLPSFS